MPEDLGPDLIRLSRPADPDLRGVVEVLAAVLARRQRFGDDAVAAARAATGTAFDDVAGAGQGPVEVEVEVLETQLVVRLRAGEVTRSVTIPDEP
jgi:hypothetical protein